MKAIFGFVLLTLICNAHALVSSPRELRDDHKPGKPGKGVPSLGVPQSVQESWVMFAPYYPADNYTSPPEGCSIDQVRPATPVLVSGLFVLYRVVAIYLDHFS